MRVTSILSQLKEYCRGLESRIFFGDVADALKVDFMSQSPIVFLLVRADQASLESGKNTNYQVIRDLFEVLLAIDASHPQQALDQLHDLRAEVWRALVGFKPGLDYNPIEYDGGELVSLSATRLLYRLHFFAEFQLGRNLPSQPAETWHERELDGLPSFTGVTVRVDAIDPADPNLQRPGPDGRLELTFSGDVTP
ncbi:phage tail terminator protein [Pseudomonas sp. QD4]|uniref:phage tail terminator protein n=1 Tax=Pseudomonas sp. QD4 TaxID=3368618 RepID=UPI003B9F11B0